MVAGSVGAELVEHGRLPAFGLPAVVGQLHGGKSGTVADAVDAYRQHGRVVTAETADAAREQLVADWWQTVDQLAADQALMVALRRADARATGSCACARIGRWGGQRHPRHHHPSP